MTASGAATPVPGEPRYRDQWPQRPVRPEMPTG